MSIETESRGQVAVATVVWGVILLVTAGLAFAVAMFDVAVITPTVIGWSVVGLGGLLVLAAIVGVVARMVRPGVSAGPGVSTGSTTESGSTE